MELDEISGTVITIHPEGGQEYQNQILAVHPIVEETFHSKLTTWWLHYRGSPKVMIGYVWKPWIFFPQKYVYNSTMYMLSKLIVDHSCGPRSQLAWLNVLNIIVFFCVCFLSSHRPSSIHHHMYSYSWWNAPLSRQIEYYLLFFPKFSFF